MNSTNNGLYVLNYGQFQGKFEKKSRRAIIFVKIENKNFSGANFYNRQAYGITQSHGLRFFYFLSFPPCLSPIFILK